MSDSFFGFDNFDFNIGPMGASDIASISPILSTFGAINSAIGSYYQAQAQKNNLRFQADMAKINAQIAEGNAQATMLAGQRQAQNVMMRGAQMKSAQKTGFAANGVDLGSRSALNVLTTTDYMTETDRNTIEANAIRAAWGYRTQSINDRNTSLLAGTAADQISPMGSGVSSLLGNSGRVAESWYKYSKG